MLPRRTFWWRAFAFGWLAVIGWSTLRSAPQQAAEVAKLHWWCVVCGDTGGADILLNLLLFLPLGLAARALGWRWQRTLPCLMALSIGIEVTQGTLLVGRDASLGDVLCNSTGGLLGWLAFPVLIALLRPGLRHARRAAWLTVFTMAALWYATGAALRPALSPATPWWGQLLHRWPGYQPFPGTMQRAAIDGIDVPNDTLQQLPPWRDSISVEVDATRNSNQLFSRGISILRIVDAENRLQLGLDQIGDNARVRVRLRADAWRLHHTNWMVPHSLRMAAGTPSRIHWSWLRDRIAITTTAIDTTPGPAIAIPLSIGVGWAFIHPYVSTVGSNRLLWTTLWLGLWFGVLGWLAGWTTASEGAVFGIVAIAVFAAASRWYGLPLLHSELAAAVGCYLFGLLAAKPTHITTSSSRAQ